MKDQRNEKGQFAAGHNGFKPVGAKKRKKNHELDCLKEVFDIIQPYVELDMKNIGCDSRVKTLLAISKILFASKKAKKKTTSKKPAPDQ